ncbi:hypothetical protein [Streptomyces sp. NRRL F-5135]|uniref:hypothetical protein n=1 Tax=Streptomyces sp. NRRL F-5135 TaxID=1463858 RepID=UPI0004C4A99E|nr:hypothetical protein [Streptomyces sp. NRRL F-5135]
MYELRNKARAFAVVTAFAVASGGVVAATSATAEPAFDAARTVSAPQPDEHTAAVRAQIKKGPNAIVRKTPTRDGEQWGIIFDQEFVNLDCHVIRDKIKWFRISGQGPDRYIRASLVKDDPVTPRC